MQPDRQTERSPAVGPGFAGSRALGNGPQIHPSARPIDALLARLDGARQYGKGWRANCPAGHSSRGTLSLAESDDGRVILNCFAGCAAADVLGAVGLNLADLFPRLDHANLPPAERARIREFAGIAQWKAALGVLAAEATVIESAAAMIGRRQTLGGDDIDRVHLAAQRIHSCREVLQ